MLVQPRRCRQKRIRPTAVLKQGNLPDICEMRHLPFQCFRAGDEMRRIPAFPTAVIEEMLPFLHARHDADFKKAVFHSTQRALSGFKEAIEIRRTVFNRVVRNRLKFNLRRLTATNAACSRSGSLYRNNIYGVFHPVHPLG